MTNVPSFERINYILRPNKQVERKMIIDLLSGLHLPTDISEYNYVGMGSIYYYDFILMHKYFGITRMISIDNKSTIKRFEFNKPYDFISFENCFTSNYLYRHNYSQNSLFWLDYDGYIGNNDSLKEDLSILGKSCKKYDLYFVTIRCDAPKSTDAKEKFLGDFSDYIPLSLKSLKYTAAEYFPIVVQEIILNMIAAATEFNDNKFLKLCSYIYKDGALMYTLGGIFTDDVNSVIHNYSGQHRITSERGTITEIKVPNITYKEKFYLDSNIVAIEQLLQHSHEYWINKAISKEEYNEKLSKHLADELEIELSHSDLSNYIKNYRFIPQYYEGII